MCSIVAFTFRSPRCRANDIARSSPQWTDYILIHGAWRGKSWCWTRVRRLAGGPGHQVFTPTLTKASENAAHLLSATVGSTPMSPMLPNLMIWETCATSSWSELPTRGRRAPRRRPDAGPDRSLVYLDASFPRTAERFRLHARIAREHAAAGCGPRRWLEDSADNASVFAVKCGGRRLGGPSVHDAPAVQL